MGKSGPPCTICSHDKRHQIEIGLVHRSAVACERAITSNLELVGKLLGQLVQRHEVRSTSFLVSPDYLQLRSVLVNALQPFPEAARAVASALHQLETKAASDITANVAKRPILIEAKAEPQE